MQTKSSLFPASLGLVLARQQQKKRHSLLSTSIFEDFQALFRAARAVTTLLVTYLLHVLSCHWCLQIVQLIFCFSHHNWQTEEDGVMGGHTRRSKQSVKASSTVICDLAATVEDWKQQIKAKDSIPANQQRLIFTSHHTGKQNFTLDNLFPSRQWQIVVDANIEDICKDLRHWRATLQSNNTSAELLQPLVLKETDELASVLHSRTAEELREIGVPCRVFFLSFKEWIPSLQSKELSTSKGQLRGIDLKVDEEFRENLFFIDLYGDLNGFPIPVPLRYVMNGSQLATKLFMVEQTAQYREDHKQRYQHSLASALKDSSAENSEGSLEVNCQTSCNNDYVVEIEQNCELTAFISRDHRRLRCIVLPVITIPLVETKGNEQHPYVYLLNGGLKEGPIESASNILALPLTSEIAEASTVTARSVVEEEHLDVTTESSTRKNTKKKRKKKVKKAAKNKVKDCTCAEDDATVEAESSFQDSSMKNSQEEAGVDATNCLNAENTNDIEKDAENESQLLVGNKSKPDSASPAVKHLKELSLATVENNANQSKQTFSEHVDLQQTCYSTIAVSKCVSSPSHEHIHEEETDCASDHYDYAMNNNKEPELFLGTGTIDESVKVGDASVHKEMSPACSPETPMHDVRGNLGLKVIDPVLRASDSGCNTGNPTISKFAGGVKKFKESFHSKFQAETESTVCRETIADYSTNSSNFQNERQDQSGSHTRVNQQSFRTHRAVADSQYYIPHRSRINQNFSTGVTPDDSRSSAPFWRHQRDGIPGSSHSWSKPRSLRADDGGRRSSPLTFRQLRNMPAWEQLPNLRQAPNGSSFPIHWENHDLLDSPWSLSSRGQSYSSFNMQQRKSGKSNKFFQKFSDRWQPQSMPNDRVTLNSNFSNALSNTTRLSSNNKAEHTKTCSKDLDENETNNFDQGPILGMNPENELETSKSLAREPSEPHINIVQMTAHTLNSSQDARWLSELDFQPTHSEIAEHVYEILHAVNASYESWGVYKQVSSLNGMSLCEFERVAKAVAPTISASTSKQSLEPMGCLCETLIPRSKRRIPDMRLSALWQWYEEPSSYGVKVKLSESSKRTGSNLQAFFVPYLSAIQLFGWSRKKKTTKNKDMGVVQGGSPFNHDFLSQPIFSILLPRPEINDDLHSSEGFSKQAKISQEGAKSDQIDDAALSSSGKHCHCDVELLYEFFELEKPQHRKPLTDRIKELVCSDGDVHMLNDAKIEDLHPSSWFAVAWYPIYKIPDETFRSAFLTYHCLGCLHSICLSSTDTNHCMDTSMHTITVPVVGLMSYNAQVKEWFSLSVSCDMNHDDVLQQYLAKLETAATSMARGACHKSSSFKHADFTFFKSRGR